MNDNKQNYGCVNCECNVAPVYHKGYWRCFQCHDEFILKKRVEHCIEALQEVNDWNVQEKYYDNI